MKGKEPEGRLKDLLPTEKLKENFQEIIEDHLKGTFKEKTLSIDKMNHILVRKILELTKPDQEYDVLLFQKVKSTTLFRVQIKIFCPKMPISHF